MDFTHQPVKQEHCLKEVKCDNDSVEVEKVEQETSSSLTCCSKAMDDNRDERGLEISDNCYQLQEATTYQEIGSSKMLQSNFNNNCSNIGPFVQDVPRKRLKSSTMTASHKGNIEATLEGKPLWDEFCRRGTEMIVNRAGRRMFPGFSVSICTLKPKAKYSMKLEVVLADNHRFKFLNSRWLAVGSAEPQPLSESYLHPDSPNSGAFWMRHGVSFRKLKITNNKERPGNNALLYSMHKYFLRLVVEEERKIHIAGGEKPAPKVVLRTDFPETTFVAVTAYQNEEVTQLKITNNPFAKAFRENAADLDWETAQMLYNNPGTPLPQQPTEQHSFGSHMMASSTWPFPSPLLPPAQLPPSLPPLSPLSGFITPHSSCSNAYLPPNPGQLTATLQTPNYFQWPVQSTRLPADMPSPTSYNHMYLKAGQLDLPVYSSASATNLPDFETVFTTLSN